MIKTDSNINLSLLALPCGDSYGSHYEYEGLCGVTFKIRSLPMKPIKPNITDDTKMSIILLRHYNENRTLNEVKLLEEYKLWANTSGLDDGIGQHTYDLLVKNKRDKNSQGNGALMRVIPFGVQLIQDGYSFNEAGFKYIVSHGGDTDTNCAIFEVVNEYNKDVRKSLAIEDFLT